MNKNKIKTASILEIVFSALSVPFYVGLWFVLLLSVGLAKGFSGGEANLLGLEVVMYLSMLIVPICVVSLVLSIITLSKSKSNSGLKNIAIALIVVVAVKIVINIINIVLAFDLIAIVFGLIAVIDIVCIVLIILGLKKLNKPNQETVAENLTETANENE